MAFQSQFNFPVKKRSVKKKQSENCNPQLKEMSVKRALFGNSKQNISPKKMKVSNENQCSRVNISKEDSSRQNPSSLAVAKQAFHTGLPSKLVGRSKEISEIRDFLSDHINNKKAGSMYISGAPGTGKTSCLMFVMKSIEKKFSHAFLNCMSVSNPESIYKNIAMKLGLSSKISSSKNIKKALEKHISTSCTMTVLILDEIDQLDCKSQQVLYSLFEWPQLPKSTLILIGIANALDMTDRMLPRLHAFKYEPTLMHFPPYTRDQIVAILEDRLCALQSNGLSIIKPLAIQFCARKIAATTGDIRKALDVCRRAIEIVESNAKRQLALKTTSDDRCNPGSPMKRTPVQWQCVDLPEISSVLHEVYGSRLQTFDCSKTVTMPLQHMILLCTLVLMKKHCKIQDMNLGRVYDVYRRICKKREITEVPECAFHGICRLVESRGFIELKAAKIARMSKLILKIDEAEAEHVMQDKAMLPSILADRSVLSNS